MTDLNNSRIRELNLTEVEQVDGGVFWKIIEWATQPTMMGNGELPQYWDTGHSCEATPMTGGDPVY